MELREIERKFLVKSEAYKAQAYRQYKIKQAYLQAHPERSVRIRIKAGHGFITIKGPSSASGTTRFEWEQEIPVQEARQLLRLCEPSKIEKTRYLVSLGQHTFEVDAFEGANRGLILAEIELETEEEAFQRPDWLGKEVTGDPKYFNARLSKKPFSTWENI